MIRWTGIKNSPFVCFHPCNGVTYLGLMAGAGAALLATHPGSGLFEGNWRTCGILLALASLADMVDGKFARLFQRGDLLRKFGAQLDSLCDSAIFGLAPVICLIGLSGGLTELSWAGFLVSAFYLLCAVTRLGYFNLVDDGQSFIGLPTTLVGVAWAYAFWWQPSGAVALVLMGVLAVAMILPVHIPRARGLWFVPYVLSPMGAVVLHGVF